MSLGAPLAKPLCRPLAGRLVPLPPNDPDAAAYFAAAGVTDATEKKKLSDWFVGLKALGLYGELIEGFALRSTQNAGTGTTAYGLRRVYNGTLVNGPTWGTDGVSFDGVDDRIEVASFSKTLAISFVGSFTFNQASSANCEYASFATIPSLAIARGSSGGAYNAAQTSPGAFPGSGINTSGDNQVSRILGFSLSNAQTLFVRHSPAATGSSATAMAQTAATATLRIGYGAVNAPQKISSFLAFNRALAIAEMQSVAALLAASLES